MVSLETSAVIDLSAAEQTHEAEAHATPGRLSLRVVLRLDRINLCLYVRDTWQEFPCRT